MEECPYCGEIVSASAVKCSFCLEILDDDLRFDDDDGPVGTVDRWILPVDRPLSAIAAGYLGLLSVLPFPFGVAAIVCGIVAIRQIKNNPSLSGGGRAWFGIAMGVVFTPIYCIMWVTYFMTP